MDSLPASRRIKFRSIESLESSKTLSEELVIRIIAMLPFPSIFKARTLSKSWLARFSPVASLRDGVERKHAILFQKEAAEKSHEWKTFFLVWFESSPFLGYHAGVLPKTWEFLNARDMTNGNLSRVLPSLSFLPDKFLTCSNPDMEGPLLYGSDRSNKMILYVANILTRKWKQLPRRPHVLGTCFFYRKKLVMERSSQTYKAIVFCGNGRDLRVQIYHSRSGVWTRNQFRLSRYLIELSSVVHLNGSLYMVAYHDFANLLAFNLEERTLQPLHIFSTDILMITNIDLIVYDTSLLVVVTNGVHAGGILLLKLDTATGHLAEVTRGPPLSSCMPSFDIKQRRRPVCDGSSIYFGIGVHVLEYRVKEDDWICWAFPNHSNEGSRCMRFWEWSAFLFQPGLNPFVEV